MTGNARRNQRRPPYCRGFTLVEVLLVVSILALLVALATPSYHGLISRAHRTEAMARLLEVAACQERNRATHGAYDTTRCLPVPNPRYRFEYSETATPRYYRIEASPLGTQRKDPCGRLMLDALGRRAASHPGGSDAECWAGR
jgi:type IV pilus assembly protein PilE